MDGRGGYAGNAATVAVLVDAGMALMRQNLRRRHARESEREISARFERWLCRQDEPIPGDVAGPVRVRTGAP